MESKTQGKAEKVFQDIGKGIDELIKDLHRAKEKMEVEYEDEINELKRNKETLKSEFKDFKENNKGKWDEVEKSLHNAAKEVQNAMEALFKKKKEG
ncbi:sll1863 family stress response protein [Fulvivirga sediminis]|uniref:Uncharacterized protein n=1 Tax=Fulvivirga sediminis TaxID=2803949 RepID=A0A937F9P1_9BACT|nr:hypothetical protein [Fulvivirga sediminis]MBL3656578.1 hypothetical protein [Fulvivirga sediminis]